MFSSFDHVFHSYSKYSYKNFINQSYYINLNSRLDRKKHIEEQLQKNHIKAIRFSAYQGKKRGLSARLACKQSHISVIEQAKRENINNISIFEDDCLFNTNFLNIAEDCFESLPNDWDMLFLGHCFSKRGDAINNYLYEANTIYCTHAYCITQKAYDKILFYLYKSQNPIDHIYAYLSSSSILNTYMCYPSIVNQIPNKSDIGEGPNSATNLI